MLAGTGGKAGVGKTPITLDVAAAASWAGRAPVVVDADRDRLVIFDCLARADRPAAVPLRYAADSIVVTRRTERAVDASKPAAMAQRLGTEPRGVVMSRGVTPGRVAAVFDAPVRRCLCLSTVGDDPACKSAESAYDALYAAFIRQNA